MGQRAALIAWPVRIAFVALIMGAAALRIGFGGSVRAGQEGLLAPARSVLVAAGYAVGPVHRRTFLNGEIQTDYYLIARHAGCSADVTIRPMRIADKPEPVAGNARAAPPLLVFGAWQGMRQSRPRILLEAARLQALSVVRLGRGVRPIPALLVVTDPSACLAIATPAWNRIWVG